MKIISLFGYRCRVRQCSNWIFYLDMCRKRIAHSLSNLIGIIHQNSNIAWVTNCWYVVHYGMRNPITDVMLKSFPTIRWKQNTTLGVPSVHMLFLMEMVRFNRINEEKKTHIRMLIKYCVINMHIWWLGGHHICTPTHTKWLGAQCWIEWKHSEVSMNNMNWERSPQTWKTITAKYRHSSGKYEIKLGSV